MTEIWKQIKDYPRYEVSNLGIVRSTDYNKSGETKILKSSKVKFGYSQVIFCVDKKIKAFRVHRLVYCVFNNVPLNTKLCVLHKDDDPSNNKLDNLWLGTQKENIHDAIYKGRLVWCKNKK